MFLIEVDESHQIKVEQPCPKWFKIALVISHLSFGLQSKDEIAFRSKKPTQANITCPREYLHVFWYNHQGEGVPRGEQHNTNNMGEKWK